MGLALGGPTDGQHALEHAVAPDEGVIKRRRYMKSNHCRQGVVGFDTITDFQPWIGRGHGGLGDRTGQGDHLDFRGVSGLGSLSQLTVKATEDGTGTIISYKEGTGDTAI